MKFLKRLDPARACWLHMLMPEATPPMLLQQEIKFRRELKGEFVGRVGRVFYFQFRNGEGRDLFLSSVASANSQQGVLTELIKP